MKKILVVAVVAMAIAFSNQSEAQGLRRYSAFQLSPYMHHGLRSIVREDFSMHMKRCGCGLDNETLARETTYGLTDSMNLIRAVALLDRQLAKDIVNEDDFWGHLKCHVYQDQENVSRAARGRDEAFMKFFVFDTASFLELTDPIRYSSELINIHQDINIATESSLKFAYSVMMGGWGHDTYRYFLILHPEARDKMLNASLGKNNQRANFERWLLDEDLKQFKRWLSKKPFSKDGLYSVNNWALMALLFPEDVNPTWLRAKGNDRWESLYWYAHDTLHTFVNPLFDHKGQLEEYVKTIAYFRMIDEGVGVLQPDAKKP